MDFETNGSPQSEAARHMDKAYSYKEAGKFEDVLRECNAAIEIDPSLAEAYNLMGIAFEEMGYENEARKSYMQAIELDPEDDDFKYNLSCLEGEAEPHMDKAYSYKKAGKFEDVLRECKAAIEIDPSLAEAYNLMGVAFEELGYEEEARESYMQAIELDPEYDDPKYNLACLEGEIGDEHQFVTVATFRHSLEAHVAKTILDREGIWSFIADEALSNLNPLVSLSLPVIDRGVKLNVMRPDAKRAFQLLNEKPE